MHTAGMYNIYKQDVFDDFFTYVYEIHDNDTRIYNRFHLIESLIYLHSVPCTVM